MLLGAGGLLKARRATTKTEVVPPEANPLERLPARIPRERNRALAVCEGDIVTSGGVTLGNDTSFSLLERFLCREVASQPARIMEYSVAVAGTREDFH